MLKSVLKKISYSILVLWGVITLVFCIFNLGPDPVENLVSENSTEEIKQAIRKKFDLDLTFGKRYVLYLNNLSPLSVHETSNSESRVYYDSDKYSGVKLFPVGGSKALFVKSPYLSRSYLNERNVDEIIKEALPGTAILAITAILIAIIIGILVGVYSAVFKGGVMDKVFTFLSVLGMSGPSFFMAIIIAWIGGWLWYETIHLPLLPIFFMLFFGSLVFLVNRIKAKSENSFKRKNVFLYAGFGLFLGFILYFLFVDKDSNQILSQTLALPGTGLSMNGSLYEVDVWKGKYINLNNLILPAITLGIRPLAVIVQLTRSAMLEELSKDYIRTAKSKGLSKIRIVFVHALRNALNPVVTAISGWFASLLAGAVFVEFVFGYKGLGMLTYNALEKDDLPVVMGAVLVIATTFVLINILVDIVYGILDPRVRMS